MIRIFLAASVGAMVLGGCVYVRADGADWERLDDVHGVEINGAHVSPQNTVLITVPSNGCTSKQDFAVDVDHDHGNYELDFERLNEDMCRAFIRDGVELTWTFDELGIPPNGRVVIKNKVRR